MPLRSATGSTRRRRGHTMAAGPLLPGRLGTPDMALRDDPRADPRMIAAMAPFGLGRSPAESPGRRRSADRGAARVRHDGRGRLRGPVRRAGERAARRRGRDPRASRSSRASTATTSRCTSTGPPTATASLPGVLHLHGGGMVLLEAAGAAYVRWRDELAASGLVVVGVEFRNGGGKHGAYPFPAGLNDCTSALRWVNEQQGRAGHLHARRVGRVGRRQPDAGDHAARPSATARLDQIDGVYAMCPYISGAYADPPPELTSLYENDGLLPRLPQMMGGLAKVYDPDRRPRDRSPGVAVPRHRRRPRRLAAPRHLGEPARSAPRRGAGLLPQAARCRRPGVCRTVNGTCHAGD